MSSSASQPNRKAHRRIHPATCSVEELLRHLATDPAAGLSPKEAARRQANSTASPLYRTTARRFSECLKRTCREVALWLLLAVALTALFFDRVTLGLVCLILAGGHAVLCAWFLYRADRVDAAMQAYDAPLCRVMRGRRVHRVGANELVKGDILFLYAGDMVPADCRLLRSDALVVRERELNAADRERPAVRLAKDARATPESTGSYRLSPVNMVFAGGIVEAGFAVATVIAVGSETHLGGLSGGLQSAHTKRMPTILKNGASRLSTINLWLVCLVLPLTIIGVITLREHYELLDIVLSALALSALTLTEHMLAKGIYAAAAIRRRAARDRDMANTADIKTAVAFETLSMVDDLILVGTAALHDGLEHPTQLWIHGMGYHCDRPEADESARSAVTWLFLYGCGMPRGFRDGIDLSSLIAAVSDWAEIDRDELLVKLKDIRQEEGEGVSGIVPTATGNSRVTVRLTDDFEVVRACTHLYSSDHARMRTTTATLPDDDMSAGAGILLGDDRLHELYSAYRTAVRAGQRALFIITEANGDAVMRAMLTYMPHTCRKTAGVIKGLEAAGIRVTAFLRDVSEVNIQAAADCGLTEQAPVDRPTATGGDADRVLAVSRMEKGCRAFAGCSEAYIMESIRTLKAAGRTVAVLATETEDIALLNAANLAITCTPSLFASAEEEHPRLTELGEGRTSTPLEEANAYVCADGQPNGAIATDLARRRADVLIRRTTEGGGGVNGIRHALLAADHFNHTYRQMCRFVFLSQAVRLLAAILPLCLGLAPATAVLLLVSGLGVDLLVMMTVISLPFPSVITAHRNTAVASERPWLTHRNSLIAAAVAIALPWGVAGIAKLCHVEFGADLTYYGALCLLGLQLALFRTEHLPRRDRSVFFATLALVLLYVGALAVALAAGLHILWAIVLPPVMPLAYVAIRWLLNRCLSPVAAET